MNLLIYQIIYLILLTYSSTRADTITQLYQNLSLQTEIENLNLCCEWEQLKSEGTCNPRNNNLNSWTMNNKGQLHSKFVESLQCEADMIDIMKLKYSPSPSQYIEGFVNSSSTNLSGVWFDENGAAYINGGNVVYYNQSYCINSINLQEELEILVCNPDCSTDNSCIRKCCSESESVVHQGNNSYGCGISNETGESLAELWMKKASTDSPSASISFIFSRLLFQKPHNLCKEQGYFKETEFLIREDGSTEVNQSYYALGHLQDYCVDKYFNKKNHKFSLVLGFCVEELVKIVANPATRQLMYSSISTIFLGASIAVYLILRDDMSIHGWMQFSFLVSVFIYYLHASCSLAIVITQIHFGFKTTTLNAALSLSHMILSRGYLLNVLNLNGHLLLTFAKLQPEIKPTEWRDFKPVITSTISCWSIALLLTPPQILLNLAGYSNDVVQAYNKAVIIMILIITFSLSIGTGVVIFQRLRQSSLITSSRTTTTSQMLFTFVRLFCVTGVILSLVIFEMLLKNSLLNSNLFWDLVDLLVHLNGVLFAIVFVCKKQTIDGLRKRFFKIPQKKSSDISTEKETTC